MAEFGHEFSNGNGICIDAWGVGPFVIIDRNGKSYRFEDSDRFGPALCKANGELFANPYPGERSPFWRAHFLWRKQGRRVSYDGITCVWREPKPTVIKHMGGKHWIIVENGEEYGDTINQATGNVVK